MLYVIGYMIKFYLSKLASIKKTLNNVQAMSQKEVIMFYGCRIPCKRISKHSPLDVKQA